MRWTDGDVARVLEEAARRPLGKRGEAGAGVGADGDAEALPPPDLLPKLQAAIPFPAPARAQRGGPGRTRALLALKQPPTAICALAGANIGTRIGNAGSCTGSMCCIWFARTAVTLRPRSNGLRASTSGS